jgi:hypothetical protein
MIKRPLSRLGVRQHLQPYATEIGHVTLAWNRLHENLALLFWYALGPGSVPFAIWDRLSSDRTQRDILETAVKAGAFAQSSPRMTEEVLWLLKQVGKLADRRNVAIHAPLTTLTDVDTGSTRVEPQTWFGNRRAKGLAGKDIIQELLLCAERADALSYFAAELIQCMSPSHSAWPERPPEQPQVDAKPLPG